MLRIFAGMFFETISIPYLSGFIIVSVLNECRGHIVVSDDHHLHTSLGNKIMGNYFIGCPMTESIKKAFVEMMMDQQFVNTDSASIAHRISVRKENLIIIDSDIWKDYPTASSIPFRIPSGYKVVYLSNIPHQQIPLLLQRAKVTCMMNL